MIPPKFAQIVWVSKRLALAQGWPSVVATGILLVCAIVMVGIITPANEKLRATQSRIAALGAAPTPRLTPAQQSQISRKNEVSAFYRMFPSRDAELDAMAKIYAAAEFWKVELHEGEYRHSQEKSGKLSRLDITLPVKGDYAAIRKFLVQTMVDVPTLSLESVNFRREKIDDPTLESTLRFTLFLSEL